MSIIPNWLRRGAHAGAGAGDGLEKTKLTLGYLKGFDLHRMAVDPPEPMRTSPTVGQAPMPVE